MDDEAQQSPDPPIDLQLLSQQTGGDRSLEKRVLAMFVDRLPADIAALREAEGSARREAAHRIVGSARALGALELGYLAARIESGERNDADAIDHLENVSNQVRKFIAGYLSARE